MIPWTDTQRQRLADLERPAAELQLQFGDPRERDRRFQRLAREGAREQRRHLEALRTGHRRPGLCLLQQRLVDALVAQGFVQVATPTIMARGLLAKMGIGAEHPLGEQVFWLDDQRCLRPMLAPHLYFVLGDLLRLWPHPVRIFEVGSCFRKESQGARHANEFTMLNLVEMGLPEADRQGRLEELAHQVAAAAGLADYRLRHETSDVYGDTVDVEAGPEHIEVGSGAMGPHRLDAAWRVSVPWVGIGFGLERLLMVRRSSANLARVGRSLVYLDGVRLNV